ncbi:hypothetical protein J2X31_000351 [Flavobacterium arsenatis]|uniref:Uncharacterized protein n=1 Tax=Flavobacterium arsenatis TaxID=1484332 RepID=A0ABU1TK55_9FLAO|nr:hypothetical protein [Flavobacterium arsenatis]MDR6966358.1 hypothetical protein [Flavobacterium arsenatis]
MEFSKEDRVIEWVINKSKFAECVIIEQSHFKPDFEFETPRELDNILKLAESHNLIDRKGKRTLIWLTQKGYDVQKAGGWLNYLEKQSIKLKKEDERQSKSDQISDLDLRSKKFDNKLGRKILIAGFIIAVLGFLINLFTSKFFPPESQNVKQNIQIEADK